MPDPRPLPSLRLGAYDEPPASSESVANRRSRIRRLLEHHRESENTAEMSTPEAPLVEHMSRRGGMRPTLRRRRSVSPLDPELDTSVPDETIYSPRRRHKRRRLENSPAPQQARKPIKYGYYGQVEPGRLKMELVSCDGGEHKDPRSPEHLGPQNILRHDKSVYCSESSCVNIVLRHVDDTAFCLEKLHIVAPENGFTSPVREGIVYIAMTMSELLEHIHASTPRPRIRVTEPEADPLHLHPPRIARERSLRASPDRLTLADALRDPEIDAVLNDRSYAHAADGLHDLSTEDPNTEEDLYAADFGSGYADLACLDPPQSYTPSLDAAGTFSQSENETSDRRSRSRSRRTRPFTLLSDEEPGPEDTSPPGWTEYRLQRWRNMRRRLDMENWDRDERWGGLNRMPPEPIPAEMAGDARERAMWNLSRLDALMARSRVRDDEEDVMTPLSPPTPPVAAPPYSRLRRFPATASDSKRDLLSPSTVDERMADGSHVTRAHFHIKKSKHKVAIKFSPPVSGRFVLLKLWAGPGHGKGNVDVQSVILKGYGGGRFFPAVEMR